MKPYHNEGFGIAYMWILILVLIFPIFLLFVTLDTWDTFVKMHLPDGDCLENAKHERVCKQTADCIIGRNFCETVGSK